jgi:hypothetical protein
VHVEWWQILIAAGFGLSTLDRGLVILEHLGLIPRRIVFWLQQRWLRRIEDQARRQALDALLTNGISTRLEALKEQMVDTSELLAGHLIEAADDRRMAAEDRQRLNELYEQIIVNGKNV